MPVKAPKNTEKRYRFFTIDRLVKAGGAVYKEKNLDDLNGAFYEKMVFSPAGPGRAGLSARLRRTVRRRRLAGH